MVTLVFLMLTIIGIILAVTWAKVHPFLVLIGAAIVMGWAGRLPPETLLAELTQGFGNPF